MGSDHKRIGLSFGRFSSEVLRAKQSKKRIYNKKELKEIIKELKFVVK